jgi:hypothetical protein
MAPLQVSTGVRPRSFQKEEEKMKRKKLASLQNITAALGLKLVPIQ